MNAISSDKWLLSAVLSLVLSLLSASSAPSKPAAHATFKVSTHDLECWNRETELGNLALPAEIESAYKPLLAGPIRLAAEPDIFSGLNGKLTQSWSGTESARWNWKGESALARFESSLQADSDGFCWYEIHLLPKRPVTLRSLRLEVPRVKETARYLHTAKFDWSNVSQGLPELGGTWSDVFTPYIWLGDEKRGLAWCAESSAPWKLANPAKTMSVKTQTNAVLLTVTFLDHEETISKPIVLRFGFQASPVKPVSFAWRAKARMLHDIHYDSFLKGTNGLCELDTLEAGGVKTVIIHDSWTKYFGQMTPANTNNFRELIEACHQRGMKLLVYVGYGIARTAPELQGKHDEWAVMPLIPWDPGYKPETRAFDATCANSGWADWLVASADRLFSDYKLDGLYFDGTSEAWRCQNQTHGCGWKDAQGNLHAIYPMLAARKLMRRVAEAVRRHNPNAILDVHMSSNLTLPTLSCADSLWNGEQFETHTAAERFQVPLHAFRTEFMGYAHGMDMEFLCYENRPFTFNEAIALSWVHGVEVRPYPKNLTYVTPIWKVMDQFGVADAKWLPYWVNKAISAEPGSVKASAWTGKKKALLLVSNLERKNLVSKIHFDPHGLGLDCKNLRAKDALTGNEIKLIGDTFDLDFVGMSCKLLELKNEVDR